MGNSVDGPVKGLSALVNARGELDVPAIGKISSTRMRALVAARNC
jgi:hypothetical protein